MKINLLTIKSIVAVSGIVLLSACSRPYATYQRSVADVRPVQTEKPVSTPAPALAETTAPVTETTPVAPAFDRLDALVRADKSLADNHRLTKRLAHVRALLTSAPTTPSAQPQKLTLGQKVLMHKLNHKIQKHTASPQGFTDKGSARIGLVAALLGLLLIIIGNSFVTTLGVIALVVGLALLILALLDII